jgi:hypothetical protein
MNSKPGYGVPVDLEEISAALNRTRCLRLAVNVLADGFDEIPLNEHGEVPVNDMLRKIHDRINKLESDAIRDSGQAEHYLIIKPISPVNPPPPEAMEKIANAVRTLQRLGMLAGQDDAFYRE